MSKPRARDLGLPLTGTPGPFNAITDVPGVLVGQTTIRRGEGPLVPGQGPVRTGVTAILPFGHDAVPRPVWAGFHALNGNGEMTGIHWVRDAGYLVGPITITNTHSVGAVHQGAVAWMIRHHAAAWHDGHVWAMPVVAETYDGVLNDINGLHVTAADAIAAIEGARGGPVAEGSCGGGTGMIAYEFKGGTGTASRLVRAGGEEFTLGVLVQANHGRRHAFTVCGVPVGRHLAEDLIASRREQGSIIVVIATDLPLRPDQLARIARRAGLGVGRGATPGGNSSGDLFLAVSTANRITLAELDGDFLSLTAVGDPVLDRAYQATVEATEEAVLNAMLAAEDMTTLRPPGLICRALPHDRLLAVMRAHGAV
jgi:D-aminopeptidase